MFLSTWEFLFCSKYDQSPKNYASTVNAPLRGEKDKTNEGIALRTLTLIKEMSFISLEYVKGTFAFPNSFS